MEEEKVVRSEDIPLLKTALSNENAGPEILPYEEELVSSLHEQLINQQATIDEAAGSPEEAFAVSLYQMEIDRVKYILASYLRTRLSKIEQFVIHILSNRDLISRLSPRELQYAKGYLDMMEAHMNTTVLEHIPEKFMGLNDSSADGDPNRNMIPQPKLDRFVFCRTKVNGDNLLLNDRGDDSIQLREGNIQVVRYALIQDLVLRGEVELI